MILAQGSDRCELLSKILYLCSLKQHLARLKDEQVVVNCFQKSCIFAH